MSRCHEIRAEQAAEALVTRGEYSHAPESLEGKLQAAPFLLPFDLTEGKADVPVWYGTVSQTVVFLSRSESAALMAYRETARPGGDGKHGDWQWQRVPLAQESKCSKR